MTAIRTILLASVALSMSTAAFAQDVSVLRIGLDGGENESDQLRRSECVAEPLKAATGVSEVQFFPSPDYNGIIQGLLGGTIDIATVPGAGTTVSLRLPLTLAIIEGLLIRVGEGRYVLPLSAVEECVELPEADRNTRGRDFLNIRGELVPFLRLRSLFGAEGEPDPYQKVIVITAGDARIGLVADQIIGNHQTVIKSMSKLHADVTMFSGATILGDGSAALILDVPQLLAIAQSGAQTVHEAA